MQNNIFYVIKFLIIILCSLWSDKHLFNSSFFSKQFCNAILYCKNKLFVEFIVLSSHIYYYYSMKLYWRISSNYFMWLVNNYVSQYLIGYYLLLLYCHNMNFTNDLNINISWLSFQNNCGSVGSCMAGYQKQLFFLLFGHSTNIVKTNLRSWGENVVYMIWKHF